MYNRYLPQDMNFEPIEWPEEQTHGNQSMASAPEPETGRGGGLLTRLLGGITGAKQPQDEKRGLGALLQSLRLDELDTGDILLLLIAGLLLWEGEDTDLAIALFLVFLLGLGEKDPNKDDPVSSADAASFHPEG